MKTTSVLVLVVLVFVVGLVSGIQLGSLSDRNIDETMELQQQSSGLPKQVMEPALSIPLTQVTAQTTAGQNELTQLQNRITELEQQLSARDKQLEEVELRFRQHGPMGIEAEGTERAPTTISKEQAQSFLPEPFASLMAKQMGRAVDYLKLHQAEEVDTQWAYEVEQNVRDYFSAHENAANLKLSSVSCKTSICEIRGYELEPETVNPIINTMAMQSWWRYGSTYVYQGSSEEGHYFYLLAKMRR